MMYHLGRGTEEQRAADIVRVAQVFGRLPLMQSWRIEVRESRARRSDQQNRYLWGVVYPEILKHLQGWDADDVHEYCLGEWSGWETLEGLGRKRVRPIRRSSHLSKLEFMDFVAHIQRKMAERGILIPDPEPAHAHAA